MKKVSLIFILLIGFGCISYAQTVTIGTQVWMTKNLDVTIFRNGDSIPQAKTNEEWIKAAKKNSLPGVIMKMTQRMARNTASYTIGMR